MQQRNQSGRARRMWTGGAAAAGLIALAALLAALALTDTGGSAHAAPQDGGLPTLAITNINGNDITVNGDGWVANEVVTLGYGTVPAGTCNQLPIPSNPLSLEGTNFQESFTWPTTIVNNTYYLCATGSVSTSTPIFTKQSVTVDSTGMVKSGTKATVTPTSPPINASGTTTTVTGSPTSKPDKTPTKAANGTPGNGGSSHANSNNDSTATLVAIILLCVLVLGLVIYLLRILLQGRQTGP
jgi:hypothetical protein